MLTWRAVAVQSRSSSGVYIPELLRPAIFAFLVLPSLYDLKDQLVVFFEPVRKTRRADPGGYALLHAALEALKLE